MARISKYGDVIISAIVKEAARDNLEAGRKKAEEIVRVKDPTMGKKYSWGRFFWDLFIFAKENGFFEKREPVKIFEKDPVSEIGEIVDGLRR